MTDCPKCRCPWARPDRPVPAAGSFDPVLHLPPLWTLFAFPGLTDAGLGTTAHVCPQCGHRF